MDATDHLVASLKRVKQEFKVYAMGMHELARMVAASCAEQGQLLGNLVFRAVSMFQALPTLFSLVLREQASAIAKLQLRLHNTAQAQEANLNEHISSLMDFVKEKAFKEGATLNEVRGPGVVGGSGWGWGRGLRWLTRH